MDVSTDDRLWDAWTEARERSPLLTAEAFVATHAPSNGELLRRLDAMLAVREAAPLPSLVDLAGTHEFAGRRLVRVLGEGATGLVYEAEHDDGRRTALKILNPLLMADGGRRDALLREARVAMSLEHPGIVSVLGAGEDRGYTWLETALVEGPPLSELVDPESPPGERVELALQVGVQLADALDHAHRRGIVHRDLKPANVMRDAEGRFQLIDFGLARVPGSAFTISRTGDSIGTPLYMAPEQMRGERDVGPRADIYALGLLVLEVAQGRRLVAPRASLQTIARIASGRVHLGRQQAAGLPAGLRRVLGRCLRPECSERYPDASTLRDDLAAVAAGGRPSSAKVPLGPVLARSSRTGKVRAFVAAAVLLAGFLLWSHRAVRLPAWERVPLEVEEGVEPDERLHRTRLVGKDRQLLELGSPKAVERDGELHVLGGVEEYRGEGRWMLHVDVGSRRVGHGEFPEARSGFQPVLLGNELYVPFGKGGRSSRGAPKVWRLDAATGEVLGSSTLPGLEAEGRSGVAATEFNGSLFYAGGWNPDRSREGKTPPIEEVWIAKASSEPGAAFTDAHRLDDLHEPRQGAVAVVQDGKAYVVGGNAAGDYPGACKTIEVYAPDPEGDSAPHEWIELAQPVAEPGVAWGVAGGEDVIVIAGGSRDNPGNIGGRSYYTDGVQVIRLSDSGPPVVGVLEERLSVPVGAPAVAVIDNRVVIGFGGNETDEMGWIDILDLDEQRAPIRLQADIPAGARALVIEEKVYFVSDQTGELFRLKL